MDVLWFVSIVLKCMNRNHVKRETIWKKNHKYDVYDWKFKKIFYHDYQKKKKKNCIKNQNKYFHFMEL